MQMPEEEYNSPALQTGVNNYLNALRVTVFSQKGKNICCLGPDM